MTNYAFFSTLPAAGNNPSQDQPSLQINNLSTNNLLAVDHVSFNANNGGTHLQVTLSSENVAAAPVDPSSVIFSAPGTASSVAQLKYINSNATFALSSVVAWGLVNASGIVSSQSINVTSATRTAIGSYDIVCAANAVNSTNFAILISPTSGLVTAPPLTKYSITGNGQFTIHFVNSSNNLVDVSQFSFMVMQI